MKKEGYIKIFRAIEDWEWIDNPVMFYFWVRILLMANWEDKDWHGITIERGSFITTLADLSDKLNLSVRQIRTCLERIKNDKQIVVETTNKWTKITVCKYDDYQGGATNERQTNDTQCDKPKTQTKEGSEYSYSNEYSYSSQEEKNNNISTTAPVHAPAYTRGKDPQPPAPFPYPAPFILSSVEKDVCRFRGMSEAQFKRNHLEINLNSIADEFHMSKAEQKKFLDYWCCSQDNRTIRAEGDTYFDLRYRVDNWMQKIRPEEQPQKSRLEQYAEKSNQLTQFINDLYGNSPDPGATTGAPVPPDDQ